MDELVIREIKRNYWLNGTAEFEDGDPLAGIENSEMVVRIVGEKVERISKEEFIAQLREGGFELYSAPMQQYYTVTDGMWLVVPEDAEVQMVSQKCGIDDYYKYKVNARYAIEVYGIPTTFKWGIPQRKVVVYSTSTPDIYEELRALRNELYIP